MILRVTDGTTTINLTGGTNGIYLAENYAPVAPDLSVVEFVAQAVRDGGDVTAITRRNVTEPAVISIVGSSLGAVQSAKTALELLFTQAINRNNSKKGPRVYVEYRAADSGEIYRSELLHARMEPDRETASEGWLKESALRFVIAWRRRFYWEGARVELALDNGSTGSKTTGGVTVYNHDDGDSGHDNWVDVDGDDVSGDLPASLEIQMQNTYNATARDYRAHVAGNVFAAPTTLGHILEGEDADYVVGSASPIAASSCSGGYYQQAVWTGDSATKALAWDLSASDLAKTQGNWFRLLARVVSPTTSGLRVRPKILFSLTEVWEGEEVDVTTSRIQDLGLVQLPPWLTGETDLYTISLALYGRVTGGATWSVDFVQLTPLDGYRYLRPSGYGAAYLTTLVDDGLNDTLYVKWGGAGKVGHYVPNGKRVTVWPGRDTRLYFLFTNNSGAVEIERTHSVKVYYRPRKLTL